MFFKHKIVYICTCYRVSPNAAAKSGRDSQCATDYITIPNGFEGTTANLAIAITIAGMDNYCGRFLASAVDLATTATICSKISI